ncbi:MAG: dipeptidyl-peptidase III [Lasallia pustulata]|uniref:Dipeptidyl peptidase 3 n=1 Tax=Lasallia pustulata TaxID=136370 RepID=A0A5M8PQ22_9LECA|nr:MAG: dipeptidyl-peptidase III [Lasallia pustulata]
MDESSYYADNPPTAVALAIKPHFGALSEKEKRYAHHLSRASFIGTRIVARQTSPESEDIYQLIIALYRACKGDWKKLQKEASISDQSLQAFLEYAAQFLANGGNYKGFGDSKFIPRVSADVIEVLASLSPNTKQLFGKIKAGKAGGMYATTQNPGLMHLGYPDRGHISSYYPDSGSVTEPEIGAVDDFLAAKGLLPENTRLRKLQNGDFELLIASAIKNPPLEDRDAGETTQWTLDGKLEGKKLKLVYGDHMEEMARIAVEIKKAGLAAANDTQKHMMDAYAKSFGTGSLKAFKESQKYWVQDKSPMVESNIGFIESYRDPAGVRAEWEGLVAMVNKDRTRVFGRLVEGAPAMIPKLPWSKDFERDTFIAPDFTSLEVLSFAGSGIPAGINIPNYEDIRRDHGFKNVSLGNVLSAKVSNERIPFIRPEDLQLYQDNRDEAFEVQVGIHELLGHGTGKLLQETSPGKYNFDVRNPPISPITNQPIENWYKPGQTWSSVFGTLSSSYEECRAEAVAMALSCEFSILEMFGFGNGEENMDGKAGDVLYASYLSMARAGIVALEFWDPKSRKWGQAHMQARYSILRTFLNAGDDFTTLEYTQKDLSDLHIRLDRSKIISHGRPAVEQYLQKLHVYKCTADLEAGRTLYEEMTHVDDWWGKDVRAEVLRRKTPRKVFVQANTFLDDGGKVQLKEYEPTLEGMIQSFAERDI